MDYFIKGIQVEETINEAKQLIDFQKVVRVSSKYKHVLHDDKKLNEKILRVFDSKNYSDRGVYKVNSKGKPEKIAGTPERCFIENGDINNKRISRKLDRDWYIDVANKRIIDFVGDGIEQISFIRVGYRYCERRTKNMKRLSDINGGKFEFDPLGLDKKINRRDNYFEKSLEELESLIDKMGIEYVKQGLRIKENFDKDVIR
ncbi:hypothetical protein [Clostridium sp.]|uniref:hypothetical protein n=1 Tax=Clostridium sp. TaxID=1506 RepID=UPI0032168619